MKYLQFTDESGKITNKSKEITYMKFKIVITCGQGWGEP